MHRKRFKTNGENRFLNEGGCLENPETTCEPQPKQSRNRVENDSCLSEMLVLHIEFETSSQIIENAFRKLSDRTEKRV